MKIGLNFLDTLLNIILKIKVENKMNEDEIKKLLQTDEIVELFQEGDIEGILDVISDIENRKSRERWIKEQRPKIADAVAKGSSLNEYENIAAKMYYLIENPHYPFRGYTTDSRITESSLSNDYIVDFDDKRQIILRKSDPVLVLKFMEDHKDEITKHHNKIWIGQPKNPTTDNLYKLNSILGNFVADLKEIELQLGNPEMEFICRCVAGPTLETVEEQ